MSTTGSVRPRRATKRQRRKDTQSAGQSSAWPNLTWRSRRRNPPRRTASFTSMQYQLQGGHNTPSSERDFSPSPEFRPDLAATLASRRSRGALAAIQRQTLVKDLLCAAPPSRPVGTYLL